MIIKITQNKIQNIKIQIQNNKLNEILLWK